MSHKFLLNKTYRSTLNVVLAGAGGTGSQMLTGLARMSIALRNLQLDDIHVIVYDPDARREVA